MFKDIGKTRLENWWQGIFGRGWDTLMDLAEWILWIIWMKWTALWRKLNLLFQAQCLLIGIMNEMEMIAGLELCLGLPNHCWVFRLPAAMTNSELVRYPCSRRTSQPLGGKSIPLPLPSHWKRIVIFLSEIAYSRFRFASLFAVLLSVPPSGDLLNVLYTVIVSDTI